MTNADKIRLIASKMPKWISGNSYTPDNMSWENSAGHLVCWTNGDGGSLTAAGESDVIEVLRLSGIRCDLEAWPPESPMNSYTISIGPLNEPPHIHAGAENKEDTTRDAAAQYWSE